MSDGNWLICSVAFVGLAGLTAVLVWLVAIAAIPSIALIPILGGLLLGIAVFYRQRRTQRKPTGSEIKPAHESETPTLTSAHSQTNDIFKDRYRLLERLASGRFGNTYVAEDITTKSKALWVIKHFVPQPDSDRDLATTQRLFKGEALMLEKLKTLDCIPKLLSYAEAEQETWFIREYVVGHPLNEELIPGKPVSEPQLKALLQGILEDLAAIQAFQVIHRDIKPSNIIRRKQDGRLILIDFGAAKIWNPQEELQPMMTVAIGTASYASYEQMSGQPVPSSDIYSAGAIGIQAITGLELSRVPLLPTGEYDWRRHGKLSPKLGEILDKMTRTRVNRRYQMATDVLADLVQL
ncbi:protein kinase [Altericista sp. CCNU0014]|uniref:protein kinase domain-containing protein n=1 Tax=Altericista sp. CCNU0014 TaxID=3082949 RepID=UPI00385175D4